MERLIRITRKNIMNWIEFMYMLIDELEKDEDVKEFVEQITTNEYKELVQKTERNEEEEKRFNELTSKINSDYIEFINQKGLEEISETIDDKFIEDEYAEILDINSGNDVEINGNKIKAADFMEVFYEMFIS